MFHEDDINESGDSEFAKSVNKFWINNRSDTSLVECEKDLYISEFLESIIDFRGKKDDDGFITVVLSDEDIQNNEIFFYIEIENNELSKHLHDIINLIDQKDHLGATTMSEVLQKFLELVNDAGIHIDSVHLENIVREIIRRPDSITKRPDFTKDNPNYIIMRISDAIMNSPSITTSFAFEKLKKQIYEVETYEKNAESFLDALFK